MVNSLNAINPQLEIINRTTTYDVIAKDIEFFNLQTKKPQKMNDQTIVKPGTSVKIPSPIEGALSREKLPFKKDTWFSTLNLAMSKPGDQQNFEKITLGTKTVKISGISANIVQVNCHSIKESFNISYQYCNYQITIGTGSE